MVCMQKSKTYPFIEIEGVKFLIKVAYNTDTMRVGVLLVREWKDLIAAKGKQHYAENKDNINARQKRHRDENPEKEAARGKRYYEAHKDERAVYKKQYDEAHKGEIALQGKKYYEENKERLAPLRKNWVQANPEKVRAYSRKWRRANIDQSAATRKKDRSENPEKFAARYKKWAQANPAKRRVTQKERRVYLSAYKDCKKLNQWFPGCDAHHIEPNIVMHIPPVLHQSVWHRMKTGHGMEEINRLAFDWLNGVSRESPQSSLDAFI